MSKNLIEIAKNAKVIPVVALNDVKQAVEIAKTLVENKLNVLEITLRTPNAWKVMDAIKDQVTGAIVGAGTVTNIEQLEKLKEKGFDYAVSPGSTIKLLRKAKELNLPYLPGCVTGSEVLQAIEEGYNFLKFFPAEASGGTKVLSGFSGPYANIKFCPTGGINPSNIQSYLSTPNVICCGGTWLVSNDDLKNNDIKNIAKKAQEVAKLVNI